MLEVISNICRISDAQYRITQPYKFLCKYRDRAKMHAKKNNKKLSDKLSHKKQNLVFIRQGEKNWIHFVS